MATVGLVVRLSTFYSMGQWYHVDTHSTLLEPTRSTAVHALPVQNAQNITRLAVILSRIQTDSPSTRSIRIQFGQFMVSQSTGVALQHNTISTDDRFQDGNLRKLRNYSTRTAG